MAIIEYDGQQHEFPDDFTDQDISRALKSHDKQQKMERFKSNLEKSPSGMLGEGMKDLAGGMVNSLLNTSRLVSSVNPVAIGASKLNPMIEKMLFGESLPREEFDPYKMMGSEEKPFYTPGGALQLVGEMFPGGIGVKPASNALKKVPPYLKSALSKAKNTLSEATVSTKPFERATELAKTQKEGAEFARESAKDIFDEAKEIRPGAISHGDIDSELGQIENEIGRNLNIESPHHIRVGEYLKNRIPQINKYWSDAYSDLMEQLTKNKFRMPSGLISKLKQINVEKFKSPYIQEVIEAMPTARDTRASSFLSKYRDVRDKVFELKQLTKDTDEVTRREIFKALPELEKYLKTVKSVLSEGLGKFKPEFERINEGYSKQVFPLRGNKVVKKALKEGKLGKNMVEELSGSGEGQELLREIIKQHPESVRNIAGQRFTSNPKELHYPNEMMREYLQEIPGLEEMLGRRSSYLKRLERNKKSSIKELTRANKELQSTQNRLKDIEKKRSHARNKLLTIGGSIGLPSIIKKLL